MKNNDGDNNALNLLEQCINNGIFAEDCTVEMLDVDLLESGVMDSMSLMMLTELIEQEYKLEIDPSIFVAELRTVNQLSSYIESNQSLT